MKKAILFLGVAIATVSSVFGADGNDYYVDAVNGNDLWDGTSATHDSGFRGPVKTLTKAMSLSASGDTVYAAPGVYNEGSDATVGYAARVRVPRGVTLRSSSGRDKTVIVGQADPEGTKGVGDAALRGVVLLKDAVLIGFTIREGYANKGGYGGGILFAETGGATAIDCVVTNCAADRGGGVCSNGSAGKWVQNKGKFVCGRVAGCVSLNPGEGVYLVDLWNTVVEGNTGPGHGTYNCRAFNCTLKDAVCGVMGHNCLIISDNGSCVMSNSYNYAHHSSSTWDNPVYSGIYTQTDAESRPIYGHNVGIGTVTGAYYNYYKNSFPSAAKDEWLDKDADGNPRIGNGTMDAGAMAFNWEQAAYTGLTVSYADLGNGTNRITIVRNFTSESLCNGFTYGSETVTFDDAEEVCVWTKDVEGDPRKTVLTPTYNDNIWYVDAVNGSDDNSGIAPSLAFRTINRAVDAAKAGGTIHCAPGVYKDNIRTDSGSGASNVAYLNKSGLTLIGDKGAANTTIEGVPGYPDGVRCVYSSYGDAVVRGFTIKNGGSAGKEDKVRDYGGGMYGGTAIDCIFSGCSAGGRGYTIYSVDTVRCVIDASNIANAGWDAVQSGAHYGSVFYKTVYTWGEDKIVNCTFIKCAPKSNGANFGHLKVYNTLVYDSGANGSVVDYYCSIISGYTPSGVTVDSESQKNVGTDGWTFSPTRYRPLQGSKLIDIGNNQNYLTNVPAAYQGTDILGGQRIVNGRIDIGAGEFSLLDVFSAALAESGVTVTNATSGVRETADGRVGVPSGNSLALTWEYPAGGEGLAPFAFTVEVDAGTTLQVTRGGRVVQTITASGTYYLSYDQDQDLVFSTKGSGEAILSNFENCEAFRITDEHGNLGIDGANLGRNPLPPGSEPKIVTFSRARYAQPLVLGVRIGKTYYPFDTATNCVSVTATFSLGGLIADVTAVYNEKSHWYVDAVNGDDANSGFTKYLARRTLQGVMKLVTSDAGDVVHAAPGVYNEGSMPIGTATNRVTVPAQCGLVADGSREETIIEGRHSDQYPNGCGTDAIRCVYLNKGAWIRGFTLRHGAVPRVSEYGNCGGGIEGWNSAPLSLAVDCIVTNCAAVRGAGVDGGLYMRCILQDCHCTTDYFYDMCAYDARGYFSCVFDNGSKHTVYGSIGSMVNCTFTDPAGLIQGNGGSIQVYNTIVGYDNGKCDFHNCRVANKSSTSSSTYDADTILSSKIYPLGLGDHFRPLRTETRLLDQGISEHYVTNLAAAVVATQGYSTVALEMLEVGGGQRIYNDNKIDLGAGEFDWRTVFADEIDAGGRVRVVAADANVTTNAVKGVLLRDGDATTLGWDMEQRCNCAVTVTPIDGGTVRVTLNGETIEPQGTLYSFVGSEGENRIEISYEGTGCAVISDCRTALRGFMMTIEYEP